MVVTEPGIIKSPVKPLPENASSPIVVTESGIIKSPVKSLPENA